MEEVKCPECYSRQAETKEYVVTPDGRIVRKWLYSPHLVAAGTIVLVAAIGSRIIEFFSTHSWVRLFDVAVYCLALWMVWRNFRASGKWRQLTTFTCSRCGHTWECGEEA